MPVSRTVFTGEELARLERVEEVAKKLCQAWWDYVNDESQTNPHDARLIRPLLDQLGKECGVPYPKSEAT